MMMVLCLEPEVSLHVDLDLGQRAVQILAHLVNVFLYKHKLPVRFWRPQMILGYKCAAFKEATMWTALNKMADIIQLYVDAKRDARGEPKPNPESLEDRFLSRFKPQNESDHDMPDENAAPDPDAPNTPSDQSSDESQADDNHDTQSTSSDESSDSRGPGD